MKRITLKKLALTLAMVLLVMGSITACGKNKVDLIPEDQLEDVTFKRGDQIADMTVTTPDGTVYKISEILEEKKAVVINFWFINCGPCQMEFPYMQEAYETYKDDIEILAINPEDGTDEKVADYQKKNELTFPMAVIGRDWATRLGVQAYPTTVIIDRYGIISFVHTGMITNVEEFNKLFEFFTADDYEQTVIRNISDIE